MELLADDGVSVGFIVFFHVSPSVSGGLGGEARAGLTGMELQADGKDGWPDGMDVCVLDGSSGMFWGNQGGSLRVCGSGGGATGVWVLMHVGLHVCCTAPVRDQE